MAQVLVVEDELLIAGMVEDALRDEGLDVAVAHSGTEAVKRLEREPRAFDLILTDINLGDGPTGFDVARLARGLHRAVRVVYVTGHPANLAQARREALTFEKPFDLCMLAAEVRRMACQQGVASWRRHGRYRQQSRGSVLSGCGQKRRVGSSEKLGGKAVRARHHIVSFQSERGDGGRARCRHHLGGPGRIFARGA